MLVFLPTPFLARVSTPSLGPPSSLLSVLQLEEWPKDHASAGPPRAPDIALAATWGARGHVGCVPQDGASSPRGNLLGNRDAGVGRGKPLSGFIIEMIRL